MTRELYRYAFKSDVLLEDIEASLVLALMATESLHGEAQVRLDASHYLDAEKHACVIDAGTSVGRDICCIFTGFAIREFGEDAFQVERVESNHQSVQPQEIHA
jgi:hypothetical protein